MIMPPRKAGEQCGREEDWASNGQPQGHQPEDKDRPWNGREAGGVRKDFGNLKIGSRPAKHPSASRTPSGKITGSGTHILTRYVPLPKHSRFPYKTEPAQIYYTLRSKVLQGKEQTQK